MSWGVEQVLTGLRIGAILLWTWVAWRVLFESWGITNAAPEMRVRGWNFWRAQLLVMAFVIVFLFSPENILRANGHIGPETGFWMLSAGVTGLHVCAYLTLIGLDIATGQRNRAWPAYIGISAVSIAYVLMVGTI